MKKTILFLALSALATSLYAEDLPFYRDRDVYKVNAQTRRTEIIYYPTAEEALTKGFEQSPWYLSLNGVWDFKYAPCEEELPAEWASIKVPGNWERQGWGTAVYVNLTYEFAPEDPQPPVLPDRIPVGVYRRSFNVPAEWAGREVFINFCGVKSGVYVYVNGTLVGYNEDSKDLARYPLNDYLKEGENELVVKCYRWSTGSWLECQDFWRISGIERDVYLSSEKPSAIEDFRVVSTLDDSFTDGVFSLTTTAPASYKLIDADGSVVASGIAPAKNVRIPSVRRWTAETPELYTLLIESEGEYTRFDVGFRRLELKGNVFYVNGQPVKFKGVNFHEHDQFTGHYVTREQIRENLKLMRSLNINAVRTCHYPQQRAFYELCDSLGFYVYDEANIETHGMGYGERSLAKHLEWLDMHMERDLNMYARTANYPCVTILSLGNEAGNGVNFERTYDALKALEKGGQNRPVVYEQARNDRNSDFQNPMYPSPDWVREQGRKPSAKPVVLCEYAHAMGNSTGSFDFYWDAFYGYQNLQGGFIWDWIDQGLAEKDSKGRAYWTYGGDYGDPAVDPAGWWKDRNFCCNGLVSPDLDVHPGAWEVKYWYQDVLIDFADYGESDEDITLDRYRVLNRFYFKSLNHDLHWEIAEDGRPVASGVKHLSLAPFESEEISIDLPEMLPDHSYYINFDVLSCEADALLPEGYAIATDQFLLRKADRPVVEPKPYKTVAKESDGRITLRGRGGKLVVDIATGTVLQYRLKGRNVFLKDFGLKPNFWTAPNDNEWGNSGPLTRYADWKDSLSVLDVSVSTDEFGGAVHVTYGLPYGCSMDVAYNLLAGGALRIDAEFHGGDEHVQVPRIGFRTRMKASCDRFRYFGPGPWESYCDRFAACRVGEYTVSAKEQCYPYLRPQETGHHYGVDWLEIGPVRISEDVTFEFSALRCSIEDLDPRTPDGGRVWGHINDIKVRPWVELCIDDRMTGLGGHDSWGSSPESVRTVWADNDYTFSIAFEKR